MNLKFFKLKKKILIEDILNFLKISEKNFLDLNRNFQKSILKYEIKLFSSFGNLSHNKLSFLTRKTILSKKIIAGCCLINKTFRNDLSEDIIKIIVEDPKLSFSKLIDNYCIKKIIKKPNYNDSNYTYVCSSAKINKNTEIGPYTYIKSNVFIGKNVKIHDRVTISDNCIIGDNVEIKSGCYIECAILEDNVVINQNSVIGKSGFGFIPLKNETKKFLHVGGVIISKNSNIGSNCNVDRGYLDDTFIGKAVMIDNQVHIGHNCFIDDYCVIAGKSGLSGSVTLEKNVILGGEVGIKDNVIIGENSIISGASKVWKSFPKNSKIGGYPAQNLYDWQRIQVNNNKIIKMRKKYE